MQYGAVVVHIFIGFAGRQHIHRKRAQRELATLCNGCGRKPGFLKGLGQGVHPAGGIIRGGHIDLPNREIRKELGRAADMVLMGMGENQDIDAGNPQIFQGIIEMPVGFVQSGVHQHGISLGGDEKDGVGIPRIKDAQFQAAAVCGNPGTGRAGHRAGCRQHAHDDCRGDSDDQNADEYE